MTNQSRGFVQGLLATVLFSVAAALTVTLLAADQGNSADDELYKKVDSSTLTFVGSVNKMKESNVTSLKSEDDTMTVTVKKVLSSDEEALKKFGSLENKELTVIADSNLRAGLASGVSAIFFVDPLVYEKNIAVTAKAVTIADEKTAAAIAAKLSAKAAQKSEDVLRSAIAGADLIVTGTVKAVKRLPGSKATELKSIARSPGSIPENGDRYKEAVVDVQSVEKPVGGPVSGPIVIVLPAMRDCLVSEPAQRIVINLPQTWLLHKNQLIPSRASALLKAEEFEGSPAQSYSALDPSDIQSADPKNLERIRRMIKEGTQ